MHGATATAMALCMLVLLAGRRSRRARRCGTAAAAAAAVHLTALAAVVDTGRQHMRCAANADDGMRVATAFTAARAATWHGCLAMACVRASG